MERNVAELEKLYRNGFAKFVSVLGSVAGSREAGRDATQEAFARALAGLDGFRGEGSLEAWVWRIALRTARERCSRSGSELVAQVPELELVEPERDVELAAALGALPPRRRLFVFLRYFADLSYAEIADVCGVAEGTVSASLAQARALLAAELTKEGAAR
jgi:RNA polymerase sigma-70 factor (ECF subfamily)